MLIRCPLRRRINGESPSFLYGNKNFRPIVHSGSCALLSPLLSRPPQDPAPEHKEYWPGSGCRPFKLGECEIKSTLPKPAPCRLLLCSRDAFLAFYKSNPPPHGRLPYAPHFLLSPPPTEKEDRLQLSSNRLLGAPPVDFSSHPVIHDVLKGSPPPYQDDPASIPVNQANRGEVDPNLSIRRIHKEEQSKVESVTGEASEGGTASVCFIHTVAPPSPSSSSEVESAMASSEVAEGSSADETNVDNDPPRASQNVASEITHESAWDKFFGDYDMYIKRSEKYIYHKSVGRGSRLCFPPEKVTPGSSDKVEKDMTNGITFSLTRDDFTSKHFDLAMQTGTVVGTPSVQDATSEVPDDPQDSSVSQEEVESPIPQSSSPSPPKLSPDLDKEHPHFNGSEFVVPFNAGPLGMELEELEGCIVVRKIMSAGQASKVPQITENTVVVGVEGFPVSTLDDLYQVCERLRTFAFAFSFSPFPFRAQDFKQGLSHAVSFPGHVLTTFILLISTCIQVMEALAEVDEFAVRRIHFFNQETPIAPPATENVADAAASADNEPPPPEEFFVTGGGQEQEVIEDDDEELLAARTTVTVDHAASAPPTPTPPPPVPPLPLSLGHSVDDRKPATIYFQNKHTSMSLRICWIDYAGEIVPRKELQPGESYMERSFSSHPWICTAVDWEQPDAKERTTMQSGIGTFVNSEKAVRKAPETSPALILRLGDVAVNALKSYNVLWDPSARSMSFMPQTKISAGRIRASLAPENARSAAARVAFARAQVIQQLRDARMDPLSRISGEQGLGSGLPNLTIILFGNRSATYRSIFATQPH